LATDHAFDVGSLEGLDLLRSRHPTWRLLCADHAPFIISFLFRTFVAEPRRQVPEGDLRNRVDDHLFAARTGAGENSYRRTAAEYIAEWSTDACGWLRASYLPGNDEPVYDLTPAAERAIDWLSGLRSRSFVGTESSLLTIVTLLREIRDGSEANPEIRLRDLEQRKEAIEAEIAQVRAGHLPVMSDVTVRDRFQLVVSTARSLLSDLRAVEQNFRHLDRETRTRIAQWDGSKGTLLSEILAHRDDIAESDQGRSFRAFWDFLMSPRRQEEFDALLQAVLSLPAVKPSEADPRLQSIRYDWLGAGEHAQRTVARLSEQLRRFLDDRAALENRRISQLISAIERHAAAVRESPPEGELMAIDGLTPEFSLPCDRPLFTPPLTVRFAAGKALIGVSDADAGVLYDQVFIDPEELATKVRTTLGEAEAVDLPTVLDRHPLVEGLAELIGYVRLAGDGDRVRATIHEDVRDAVGWTDHEGRRRRASLPHIVFIR
jgi:hypothetical protein